MTAVCLHTCYRRFCLIGKLAVDPVEQEFREAQNRIERGPQLVAHIREELGFVAAGCLQLPALLLYLAEQLGVLDRKHRLRREGLQKVDDLLDEFARFAAPDNQSANDLVRSEQRNNENAAISGVENRFQCERLRSFAEIRQLNRRAASCRLPDSGII